MILTFDKKNIYFGNLKVQKYDDLKEVRDYLMKFNEFPAHYQVSEVESSSFASLVQEGYRRRNDTLIYSEIIGKTDDECDYKKKEFQSVYLNSILLFTSLLCDLDASEHDEIVRKFIECGIIKMAPLERIWNVCSQRITDFSNESIRKMRIQDLKAFQAAISEGLISYHVEEQVSIRDCGCSLFKGITRQDLDQYSANSALLLGDNSSLKKYIRRKNG